MEFRRAIGTEPWFVVDEARPEYPGRYGTSGGGNPRGAGRLGKCGDSGVVLRSSCNLNGEPLACLLYTSDAADE